MYRFADLRHGLSLGATVARGRTSQSKRGVAALLAALLLIPATLGASPSPRAEEALERRLVDQAGSPLAGREVGVFAEVHDVDDDGTEIIRLERLGSLTANKKGMLVDNKGFGAKAAAMEDDRPSLMLFSVDDGSLVMEHVDLTDEGEPDGDVGTDHASPEQEEESLEAGTLEAAATSSSASATNPCGDTGGPYLVATDSYQTRYTPFQRTQTRGGTTASYSWSSTNNTKLEIAADGKYGSAAAGLTASSQNTTTGGFSSSLGTFTSRRVDANWRYRRYNIHCTPLSGPSYYSGQWEWRPYNWTAGNRNVDSQPALSCKSGTTVRIDNQTWVAQSSTTTYNGYFSIAGVALRSQQQNSSSHKLTFTPTSASAQLCGTTGYPSSSAQVREAP